MTQEIFKGLGVSLVTPFIQRDSFRSYKIGQKVAIEYPEKIYKPGFFGQLDRLIEKKPDFFVVCDVAGESATLNYDEHVKMIEAVVQRAQRRIPVLAATGANSTIEAIELSRKAKYAGAEGVLIVVPYYIRPPEAGIVMHFRNIRKELGEKYPIILYDNPGRTGISVSAKTILMLAHEGTIQGVKLASGEIQQARDIARARPQNFTILVGDDRLIYSLMQESADGAVSVAANIVFDEMRQLVDFASQKSFAKALECHEKLHELFVELEAETNPIPIKTALALIYPKDFFKIFRSPLCPLDAVEFGAAKEERLIRVLRSLDLM